MIGKSGFWKKKIDLETIEASDTLFSQSNDSKQYNANTNTVGALAVRHFYLQTCQQ